MKQKLSFQQNLLIGSLLFGLFFGAGNLIFPVQMGQQAGDHAFTATIGFLITGVRITYIRDYRICSFKKWKFIWYGEAY